MFTRVRIAIGFVLVAILMSSVTVFAKGGFDFITITDPALKESVHVTDTSLTTDFFAFTNFYEDKTRAPTDPGIGYEITRHYVQGKNDVVFDRLHYYPEAGVVFYDGIENGDSEYDGEWYTANPDIKSAFESALAIQTGSAELAKKNQPVTSSSQSEEAVAQAKPFLASISSLLIVIIVFAAGLAAISALTLWRRKPSTQ